MVGSVLHIMMRWTGTLQPHHVRTVQGLHIGCEAWHSGGSSSRDVRPSLRPCTLSGVELLWLRVLEGRTATPTAEALVQLPPVSTPVQ